MKLEIRDLEFSYDSTPVLEDLNLRVEAGEVLGIIGPNGSGKTTLLKCINRILEPQFGEILVGSTGISELDRIEIAKKMGYVSQIRGKSFPSTVFDTILMGRKPHGGWKPSSKDFEKTSRIIEVLGLEEISMRDVGQISGGQLQKVMIGRALAQEPKTLLLDEPTSSLDLKHQLEVMNLISDQASKGVSVIMVIHDLNLAGRYSDKLVMLCDGKVSAAGGLEILNSDNIRNIYGVEAEVERRPYGVVVFPIDSDKNNVL